MHVLALRLGVKPAHRPPVGNHLFADIRPPPAPLAISRLFNRLPAPRSGSVRLCYKNARFVISGLNEFVFRYNRRFYRHVSFETMLGIASRCGPVSYWDIARRENPRKGETVVRKTPRRRKTAAGMRQDGVKAGHPLAIQPIGPVQGLPGTTG